MRDERLGHASAQRRAPGRLQGRVERVLIQHVHEAVVLRERQVGELALGTALDKHMHAFEHVEALFDVRRVHLGGFAQNRRVEFGPLDARRHQQLAVGVVELLDLPLDHAADRFRQVPRTALRRGREPPASLLLEDAAGIPEIPKEVGHEERITLGLLVDVGGERGRERVVREFEREVALDVRPLEKAQRQVFEQAARPKVALDIEKWVLHQRHFRRPVRREHEHAHIGEAAREIVQQIDRRDVGPVQVVEEQNDRLRPRQVLEERAELALQPLLRRRLHLGSNLGDGRLVAHAGGDLQVPGRRHGLQQLMNRLLDLPMEQAVHRVENREVGL